MAGFGSDFGKQALARIQVSVDKMCSCVKSTASVQEASVDKMCSCVKSFASVQDITHHIVAGFAHIIFTTL